AAVGERIAQVRWLDSDDALPLPARRWPARGQLLSRWPSAAAAVRSPRPLKETRTMSSASTTTCQPVLIAGRWRQANLADSFRASDPSQNRAIERDFPVSTWADIDEALDAAAAAAVGLRRTPAEKIAQFLEAHADSTHAKAEDLDDAAHQESGLARSPRLADVELPRTVNQLRLAATAARTGDWAMPVID